MVPLRGDDFLSLDIIAVLYTLLNHVTSEFVLGKCDKLSRDEGDDLDSVLRIAMLDDMLRNVVAILVNNEAWRACMKLLE